MKTLPWAPGRSCRSADWLVRTSVSSDACRSCHVGVRLLVEDDEVHRQPLHAPVLVRAEELADDVPVLGLVDPDQDDREVAGDAVAARARRPPSRLRFSVSADGRSVGSE